MRFASVYLIASIILAAWLPAPAADVQLYGVSKTRSYAQVSPGAAALFPTNAFTFAVFVVPTTLTSVTSSAYTKPGGTAQAMNRPPESLTFSAGAQYNTQALMDAEFPNGSYAFAMVVTSDLPVFNRSTSLSLTGDGYPNEPVIVNFAAMQNVDWTQPLTVQWNPFVGGDTQYDFIQLVITRANGSRLWASPDAGQTGALNGAATQVTIPANTLVPGESYKATLGFVNATVNFTGYAMGYPNAFNPSPIVPGVATYSSTTTFDITAPGSTPSLIITPGAGGSLNLFWNADIGRTYSLRSSPDLLIWTLVQDITADATSETVNITPPNGATTLFYRLFKP
ncbi:MAG: hypothetical protein HS117_10795 [Verrucomicrobiaceae bacterium]|jgi:hypothetical protein|nr:hypothetical protein [Verrucomicrobiaceae bacterium]